MYAPRGKGGGGILLCNFIAYYLQKGREVVQIACQIAYILLKLKARMTTEACTVLANSCNYISSKATMEQV